MHIEQQDPVELPHQPVVLTGFWRWVYIVLGCFCLALAYIGWFMPGIPWSPFVLLASLCFGKSSPKLDAWLLNNKYFGSYLYDVRFHRGVRRQMKINATITIIIVVAISVTTLVLTNRPWYIWVSIPPLAFIGLMVLWRGLRTLLDERTFKGKVKPSTSVA